MNDNRLAFTAFIMVLAVIALMPVATALVSVSQMGYHPEGVKTATVYTTAASGTYALKSGSTVVKSGALVKATDAAGNPVECQGNNPCLIADFSDVKTPGTYMITATTTITEQSAPFTIGTNIYRSNAAVFPEFFNALRQQGSSYHADMNGFMEPSFPAMADGSYIMTAHQAGTTLIRLGSAYRRNPQLVGDAVIDDMISYADYLAVLQDAKIETAPAGTGFRLSQAMTPAGAFVPGPTDLTTLAVYDDGGTQIASLPVRSLCGNLSGMAQSACLERAAEFYKCQADEPCIELVYNGPTGMLSAGTDGYGVDNGWYYEWSCYFDVDLAAGNYNTQANPCLIYDDDENAQNAAIALLAYTEAIPAINKKSPAKAQALLDRAIATRDHIKATYSLSGEDAGLYGAANFLLYDMTGNAEYLQEAHAMRGSVPQVLVSDGTRGPEFYWREYVRHRRALEASSLPYAIGGNDPANVFVGKMASDYYNGNDQLAISKNAERVYQVYRNSGFQNSRQMLVESVIASKTLELGGPAYAKTVADSQLAWLTGNNAVDTSIASSGDSIESVSFIFGIGDFPSEFHSRLLMDSGYSAASGGEIAGMRGTGLKFRDGSGSLVYLDGKSTVLGEEFGAQGNGWRGEAKTEWLGPKSFKNGKTYIPGWINGAFDVPVSSDPGEVDDIYNYHDSRDTYEYTETTNEIVATAIEAFAYADARYNAVQPLSIPQLIDEGVVIPPDPIIFNSTNTTPPNSTNQTNTSASILLRSTPAGADVYFDTIYKGLTPALGYMAINTTAGTHSLNIQLSGYAPYSEQLTLAAGENRTLNVTLTKVNTTNQTNQTPQPGAPRIVRQEAQNVTRQGADYAMPETGTGVFIVEFNQTARIDWYVNGKLMATENAAVSAFAWSPMILYVGDKTRDAVITASGNGMTNATFLVHVSDVINPFWDATNSTQSPTVIVYTQDAFARYATVGVVLENGGTWTQMLDFEWNGGGETVWRKQIDDIREGTTRIKSVVVQENGTGKTTVYDLNGERSHYRRGESERPRGRAAGGGAALPERPPELVYAIFSNDTIPIGGSVTLSADLRDNEEVRTADAILMHEDGTEQAIPLALTSGAKGYGTWTATITGNKPGKYTLMEIQLTDNARTNATAVVGDRAFYVLSDTVLASEELLLVYAIFNQSTIMPGEEIGITLDVRDFVGVESVDVLLKSKDREIPVKLERTSGTANYGTWQGSVRLDDSDATFALVSARMSNGEQSKETRIYGQKVYVQYVKPADLVAQENAAGPKRTELRQIVRNPITPLLIGLVGMGIAMLIVSSMTFMKTEK